MKSSVFYLSPLGTLEIQIKDHKIYSVLKACGSPPSPLLKEKAHLSTNKFYQALVQKTTLFLDDYFLKRSKKASSLPLFLRGSVFQQKVWHSLRKIPYGTTRAYSDIAQTLGTTHLARAVGSACAQNPFLIIVPCHRVVAKQSLGGFALGLKSKKFLLKHEQSEIRG